MQNKCRKKFVQQSAIMNAEHEPFTSSSSPDPAATSFADQCLICPTVRCAAMCRRQTDKYPRGFVVTCDSCLKHRQTYLRCVQCGLVVHLGCDDGGGSVRLSWTCTWKCYKCVVSPGLTVTSGFVSSAATLQVEQLPTPTAAAVATICDAVSSTSSMLEQTYDSYDSMYCAIRKSGFHVRTKNFAVRNGAVTDQLRSIFWECKLCGNKFTAYTSDGEEFVVVPKDHSDNCPCKPQSKSGPVGAIVVKHTHELAAHKGLQKFIQEWGAYGKHSVGVHPH